MIQRGVALGVKRQCELRGISRACVYDQPRPVSEHDRARMRRIDEWHREHPFLGARRLAKWLTREGYRVGRRQVGYLMRLMGLEALSRKPRTSRPGDGHRIYPYLWSGLALTRAHQVGAADICDLPLAPGFLYWVARLDWYSRKVLAWKLSNTLTPDFCVAALQAALAEYGVPEIFNSDQGSPFTDHDFTSVLSAHGIRISMDGKGRWRDNGFVERLWRSVK